MINTIVADDERHARERLISLLGNYPDIKIIGQAADTDEIIPLLQSEHVDVAFLDINMPGPPVFGIISALPQPPLIIFQTAYSEYAVNAFEIDALDYLMKPVSGERLDVCIGKIKKALPPEKILPQTPLTQLSVKYNSIMKVINIKDIFTIKTEEGFSFIYTDEGRFLSDRSLNYFEEILTQLRFYRVSRTAIINLDYVKVLHPLFKGSYRLELRNGTKITVSRRRMKTLKELLQFL
ncbi:MAG: response regulator transcription factor [Spirochaetales bacterium]|nr:response regulator transcription factor [Spirochaetales bacterium]